MYHMYVYYYNIIRDTFLFIFYHRQRLLCNGFYIFIAVITMHKYVLNGSIIIVFQRRVEIARPTSIIVCNFVYRLYYNGICI